MLCRHQLSGEEIDSLELEVLLITRGVNVAAEVYEQYEKSSRISRNPVECNCLILPGNVVAISWPGKHNRAHLLFLRED